MFVFGHLFFFQIYWIICRMYLHLYAKQTMHARIQTHTHSRMCIEGEIGHSVATVRFGAIIFVVVVIVFVISWSATNDHIIGIKVWINVLLWHGRRRWRWCHRRCHYRATHNAAGIDCFVGRHYVKLWQFRFKLFKPKDCVVGNTRYGSIDGITRNCEEQTAKKKSKQINK